MGRVRRKLKSRRGASLMVALLFFVMMAVIGSVILAAASAGMGRVKDEDEGDQERYALYSAAKLVVNAFAGQSAFNINEQGSDPDTADLQYKTKEPVAYYTDAVTGQKYSDEDLGSEITSVNANWPLTSELNINPPTVNNSDSLEQIRVALGKALLKECYESKYDANTNDPFPEWQDGSTESWTHWTNELNKSENEKKFTFQIWPDQNWTDDTKKGRYKVEVELSIDSSFNVTGTLAVAKGAQIGHEDNSKEDDYITGQIYHVYIPFSTNAELEYTSEEARTSSTASIPKYAVRYQYTNGDPINSEWISTNENFDVTAPEEVENGSRQVRNTQYREYVSQNRIVSFKNFKWQEENRAKITTLSLTPSNSETTAQ